MSKFMQCLPALRKKDLQKRRIISLAPSLIDDDDSEVARASRPSSFSAISAGRLRSDNNQNSGSSQSTPSEYDVVTEPCDWCLSDTPWDEGYEENWCQEGKEASPQAVAGNSPKCPAKSLRRSNPVTTEGTDVHRKR